jgi:hypothetical protein
MMDYINAVGTIVVYDEDFVCSKCTCRHSEFDQTESIYFGDNVDVFSINVIQNLGKRTRWMFRCRVYHCCVRSSLERMGLFHATNYKSIPSSSAWLDVSAFHPAFFFVFDEYSKLL